MSNGMKRARDTVDKTRTSHGMREKQIEQKLVQAVKAAGGICPKWVSPGLDGVPDRIILLPGCLMGFAEIKAPGMEPRPLQTNRHRQLRALGFPVFVVDSPEQISAVIEEVQKWRTPSR